MAQQLQEISQSNQEITFIIKARIPYIHGVAIPVITEDIIRVGDSLGYDFNQTMQKVFKDKIRYSQYNLHYHSLAKDLTNKCLYYTK